MEPKKRTDNALSLFFQPLLLLSVLLTFSIGVGLSHHLGKSIDWVSIILGVFLGIFLVLMRNFLTAYFDHPSAPTSKLSSDDVRFQVLKPINRQTILIVGLTILTAGALDTLLLVMRRALNPSELLILGFSFLLCYFYGVPPIHYSKRGFAEVSEAILIANLIPTYAYLISNQSVHVLLVMITFPLTLFYLAFKITRSLESYAFDRIHGYQTMVVKMDWQKAMTTHNFLVMAGFLLTGIFLWIGLPWALAWPMLLTIVLGIFQIIQMQSIAGGSKPKWVLLKWTAAGTFAVTAYLISFTLWII